MDVPDVITTVLTREMQKKEFRVRAEGDMRREAEIEVMHFEDGGRDTSQGIQVTTRT